MKKIFICGCGHSGTTLMTAMLGAHPQIFSIYVETRVFMKAHKGEAGIRAFFDKWESSEEIGSADYLCEKTPQHIRRLDLIRRIYPDATIITPIRDARDVTLSIKLRKELLEEGITHWLKDNTIIRDRMENEKDIVPYRYEDLIDDPQAILTMLCEKIGVAFDPKMLEYHKDERDWWRAERRDEVESLYKSGEPIAGDKHRELRNWQLHQPILDRRARWRTGLTEDEVAEIEERCGELMQYFHYTLSRDEKPTDETAQVAAS